MRARVHAAAGLVGRAQTELERDFDLLDAPAGADGLIVTPVDSVDGAYLDAAGPQLRIVANHGVGFDNVDLDAARERGIVVTNTPDVLTRATAEFAIALMLALLRRVPEGDRLVRRRDPWRLAPDFMLGRGLEGLELGIVGPGRIGLETARLGEALGMRVSTAGRDDALGPLLRRADVVSLHAPLTPGTRRLIDEDALLQMKPEAVLVNTARGALVDEAALVVALREGRIAGAALDVFEAEPHVREELLSLENVVLTPHVASATHAAREAMGLLCVDALRAVLLEDRRPQHALM